MDILQFDFVVIGSGLAGSTAAYLLSEFGEVALVAKHTPMSSNSWAAQGGIAASMADTDSPALHLQDTLAAGGGLCHPAVVQELVTLAPKLMNWLMEIGVSFDRDATGALSLGLEGAHSQRRILHAGGDATGANVLRVMTEVLDTLPRIQRLSPAFVQSLYRTDGRVYGAIAKLYGEKEVLLIGKKATVLATGGLGQLFAHTTNPLGATGEGVALAYQAGAAVRNLEFIQFHPTALKSEQNPQFLISEAVRGAGGHLIDAGGRAVMEDHPMGDLAPRDQVARRIYHVQQAGGEVYLDGTGISGFSEKFPTIFHRCLSDGINPASTPIPVSPAAHFVMGGIAATLAGATNIPGLYAIGETACTGVHGANRLASNSLLECVGMAHQLAEHLQKCSKLEGLQQVLKGVERLFQFEPDRQESLAPLRQIMWKAAGIVRNRQTLVWGLDHVSKLKNRYPRSAAAITAELILKSALLREESRGAHYREDFPMENERLSQWETVITEPEDALLSV